MSRAIQLASLNLPVGSLDAYIFRINQVPLLTLEQEIEFARRLQNEGDVESAKQLVLAHLRYVVRVARGYLGYGLPLNDLIQEGNIGLMKAVKRFNPEMGVRLVSFAVHWIKSEIHEFIIKNWRMVKIATTKAQRKLFFNLREMRSKLERFRTDGSRLGWMSKEDVNAIATDLGVTPHHVRQMEERLNGMDMSFDVPEGDEDESYRSPVAYLHDEHADPARIVEREMTDDSVQDKLAYALTTLDSRSQYVLQNRWLAEDKKTLHELAAALDVSAERVRQIEKIAMNKLRKLLSDTIS
jgi:RNA polymerase sigma-32 factor